jgi:hypothetical protein
MPFTFSHAPGMNAYTSAAAKADASAEPVTACA